MWRVGGAVLLSALLASGCGQSETVPVQGTLMFKGKPAENAEVMFNAKKGRLATGVTNAEGKFTLSTAKLNDGAMPGEYIVTLGEYYPPDKPPAMPRDGGPLPTRFPPQYGDPSKSPLTATVERGKENVFDFEVGK